MKANTSREVEKQDKGGKVAKKEYIVKPATTVSDWSFILLGNPL